MRIVLAGPAHPYKGGGARHTTELAHRLARAGHPTVLETWRAQYPAALYPGVQTIGDPEGPEYRPVRRDLAWYRPDGWVRAGLRAGRSADLVAAAVLTPVQAPAYTALLAAAQRRARTAVIAHNVLPHEPRPGDSALMAALLGRADTVVVHSAEQAELARGLAPGADVRVAELPPHLPAPAASPQGDGAARGGAGVESGERAADGAGAGGAGAGGAGGAAPADRPPHFLFFGIVRPYKGVDVLLRAFAAGAGPDARLTVAGEFWGGSGELAALARALGIADRVELREGYVPAAEVPALFAGADALVLPYRTATATQNVWLARAHGLPVIATRAGTLPDRITDGADGLLCTPGDPGDLARALTAFRDPATAARLRSGSRSATPSAETDRLWSAYVRALTAPSIVDGGSVAVGDQ